MSTICSELGDNQFPTDGSQIPCENDVALQMLKKIFGEDFIHSFYVPGTPHPAVIDPASDTIMSLIASNLSHAALIATALIIIVSIYKGLISGASDGVAVAFTEKSSLMGLFGRPLFSLMMLMPTVSGFPVIYLLVMFITLTSNGITNAGFKEYIEVDYKPSGSVARLNDSSYMSANDLMAPAFYGALHGYCVSYANNVLDADMRLVMTQEFEVSTATGSRSYSNRNEARSKAQDAWGAAADRSGAIATKQKLEYKDRSGAQHAVTQFAAKWFGIGTLGVPGDICGTFESKPNSIRFITGESDTDIKSISNQVTNKIRELGYDISRERTRYALSAYYDAFAMANRGSDKAPNRLPHMDDEIPQGQTSPTAFCNSNIGSCSVSSSLHKANGWAFESEDYAASSDEDNLRPNVNNIIEIALYHQALLDNSVKNTILAGGYGYVDVDGTTNLPTSTFIQNKMSLIVDATLEQGWMAAGTYRARVQKFKNALRDSLYTNPVSVSFSNIDPDEESGSIATFVSHLNTVKTALYGEIANDSRVPYYSPLKTEASVAQFDIKSKNPELIMNSMTGNFTTTILETERNLITYITGSGENDNVDALTRIQEVGETIAGLSLALAVLHRGVIIVLTLLSMTLGAGGAGVVSMVYSFEVAINAILEMYTNTLGGWVLDVSDSLFDISRIFSVVIPTMPYVFLALAAVGWLMQIAQTAFGMPLFFIMHSVPERSFVGSQAQGYVTLVSLAFRPIIILAAFFLAFVIYDPVVTYVTQAYFSIHEEISGSSTDHDVAKFFIVASTFKYYWFIYGSILMMVTYLIFGLVQELGDSVLDWLGTNLLRGFGNMDTGGVMKGASGGMSQFAQKQRASKQKRKDAQREKEAELKNSAPPSQQGGSPGAAGGGGTGGAGNPNQPARRPSGSFGGGAGAAPSAHPSMNTGFNRAGQPGAALAMSALSGTRGAVIGAGQGMRSGASAGHRAIKGNGWIAKGARPIAAGVGAAAGTVVGAARGAGSGVVRGAAVLGGKSAYQNTLNKQARKGSYGIIGSGNVHRSKVLSKTLGRSAMQPGASSVRTRASVVGSAGATVMPTAAAANQDMYQMNFRRVTPHRTVGQRAMAGASRAAGFARGAMRPRASGL